MLCQIDAPRMAVVATRPGWRLPAGRTASQEVERLSNTLKLHKPSQILMSHAVRATRVEPMLGFSCRGASGNDKLCNKSFGTLKSLKTLYFHFQQRHFSCHLCDKAGKIHQYIENYRALEQVVSGSLQTTVLSISDHTLPSSHLCSFAQSALPCRALPMQRAIVQGSSFCGLSGRAGTPGTRFARSPALAQHLPECPSRLRWSSNGGGGRESREPGRVCAR
mmetsp:Transcript_54587/g.150239  ORF Transcript_54587/g.150239 Transcript_54587/m.150239 type:complete len:221 (-) Transcript_54587:927-1589(-)